MKLEKIIKQPFVATDHFDLRPLRHSDTGLMEFYTKDERVARMTPSIPHPLPAGATEAKVSRALAKDRDEDIWAIDGTRSGLSEVLGLVSLHRMGNNQSELSYWVAPAFWNKGVASEVTKAIVQHNPMLNKTIFAAVFQDNPASARVLTNCGFDYVGDAEAFCVARQANVATWTYLKTFDDR
jgi:RimJ/RimL family protein N-acetyltransferase